MKQALILVDIQNDYFPGGAMELAGSPAAGAQAAKLLHAFRKKALPIIHIQHVATKEAATFFLPGTSGVQIHWSVAPIEGETVFLKHFPNSFRETPLLEHLHQHRITHLVVAGMMTHMCIDTTIRAGSDLGFECGLAFDACATKSLIFGALAVPAEWVQASYLAALDGSFARVTSTEELCNNLSA
jgi:nicotinamidase-related amidase